jgi:hypothetical protein
VNNPIAGSLVLDPATNSITFMATNTALEAANSFPVLPNGMYTATVHSSAATDGFQALYSGGGFLDGLFTGTAGSGELKVDETVVTARTWSGSRMLPQVRAWP